MNTIQRQFNDQLFDVRRSVRYHLHRRRFFESAQDFTTFLSALFGSAAFASIVADGPPWMGLTSAAIIAFMSLLSLVYGFRRKAWLYADLARQFIELERVLEACHSNPTEEALTEIADRQLVIEMSEPPIRRALDMICYNEVAQATYEDYEKHLYKIGPVRRLLAQFLAFHSVEWKKA